MINYYANNKHLNEEVFEWEFIADNGIIEISSDSYQL